MPDVVEKPGDPAQLLPSPKTRMLRVFAFDPQASIELETAVINDAIVELPWEAGWEDPICKGPVNEYLEVVDYDAPSGCFYPPVDLNHPDLLAQSGLAPTDGNPQFHQQMVFAIAMKVIRTFERALGRTVLFIREPPQPSGFANPSDDPSSQAQRPEPGPIRRREYVRRLRIYPHAMREANAYYSPTKAALLFGYFRGKPARDGTGGGWVFSCLSQDIVAHETTHAILHGMWPGSIEKSNPDSLAFHEAFADIVALLQHFTRRAVIEHELSRSGGSLRSVGLLNGLAQQFGRATGREGPLRFALDMVIAEEEALAEHKTLAPDRNAGVIEQHKRGQILVAAVFDAFVTVFERRTADLFRMTGRRRGDGEAMPSDLVARLADEACRTAEKVLGLCIRGLDYLPPVDITFDAFLRAIITADADLLAEDPDNMRIAFAEAFRNRGITVQGDAFSSTDSLLLPKPEPFRTARREQGDLHATADASFSEVLGKLQLTVAFGDMSRFDEVSDQTFEGARAYGAGRNPEKRNLRDLGMMIARFNQRTIHNWLVKPADDTEEWADDTEEWERLLGIFLRKDQLPPSVNNLHGKPLVEVHSARVSRRQAPNGDMLQQLIVQIVQKRRAWLNPNDQQDCDKGGMAPDDPRWLNPNFVFRGGSTVLADLNDGHVRRIITRDIGVTPDGVARLARQRAFLLGDPAAFTFEGPGDPAKGEPFAMLHRGRS